MKKIVKLFVGVIAASSILAGCGAQKGIKEAEAPNVPNVQETVNTAEVVESSSTEATNEVAENETSAEASTSSSEEETTIADADSTTLFDQFMAGEIDAIYYDYDGNEQTISAEDMSFNGEEWDATKFFGYKDVDNDGEEELLLRGPYGFDLFDIQDGKLVLFARGEGAGATCLLASYEDKIWVVYAHAYADEEYYNFDLYNGSETIEKSFGINAETDESGNTTYKYNNMNGETNTITAEEFEEISSSILDY